MAETMMKLLNSVEKGNIERAFVERSGLRRDQFAMSSWNFPVIPIPEHREVVEGTFREAPQEVKKDFLGHPIYWIDYELTRYDPEAETEDAWAIRMYHLIMAFDLWDSTPEGTRWVDVLALNDIVVTDTDYATYTQKRANQFTTTKCRLDDLGQYNLPMAETQMMMPWNKVDSVYQAVLQECDRRLKEKIDTFYDQQLKALDNADIYMGLGLDKEDPNVNAGSPGGWWMQHMHYQLEKAESLYKDAFISGQTKAPYAREAVALAEKLSDNIVIINQTIGVLSIPIVRAAVTMSQAYSEMMTYLKIAAYRSSSINYKDKYKKVIEEDINKEITHDEYLDVIPDINDLKRTMWLDYDAAWKRLRLTVANYDHLNSSLPPFPRYVDLMDYLTAMWSEKEVEEQLDTGQQAGQAIDTVADTTPVPVTVDYKETFDFEEIDDLLLDDDIADIDISLDD